MGGEKLRRSLIPGVSPCNWLHSVSSLSVWEGVWVVHGSFAMCGIVKFEGMLASCVLDKSCETE